MGILYKGDCLELFPSIPNKSVDMILCDLPYGSTSAKWDIIIPLDTLWGHYKRIMKDKCAIVLTASQPFTSLLVMSNLEMFKHEWVWVKNTSTGMMLAGKAPMKRHESVLVFGNSVTFNPQKVLGSEVSQNHSKKGYSYKNKSSKLYDVEGGVPFVWSEYVNPHSVLPCDSVGNRDKNKIHPTQKPLALFEYLIKTYTDEGNTVLDNCSGSGTSAVAADNLKRDWICMEKDADYYEKSLARINKNRELLGLQPVNVVK
jgi:site-specific DNA-methyltransferase (adenine-specific)